MRKLGALILAGLLSAASPVLLLTRAQEAQQPANAQSVLTNNDIVELQKSGLSAEIMVAKIKTAKSQFDTSPAALQELKGKNIPDAVILAMIEAGKPAPPPEMAKPAIPVAPEMLEVEAEDGTPLEIQLETDISGQKNKVGDIRHYRK